MTVAHRPHRHHPRLGADVEFELALAVVLVVLVIFLFLRNLRGHADSQPVGAAVAGRHAGGHVSRRASASTICR